MLTVKHIENSGSEYLVQARRVSFVPKYDASAGPKTEDNLDGVVLWMSESGFAEDAIRFYTGICYVMNDAGATVAKYDLGHQDSLMVKPG